MDNYYKDDHKKIICKIFFRVNTVEFELAGNHKNSLVWLVEFYGISTIVGY